MENTSRQEIQNTSKRLFEILDILEAKTPYFGPYENVRMQINAILDFIKDDRTPTQEDKDTIDVGLVAMRELEDIPLPEIPELCRLIKRIIYLLENGE